MATIILFTSNQYDWCHELTYHTCNMNRNKKNQKCIHIASTFEVQVNTQHVFNKKERKKDGYRSTNKLKQAD